MTALAAGSGSVRSPGSRHRAVGEATPQVITPDQRRAAKAKRKAARAARKKQRA